MEEDLHIFDSISENGQKYIKEKIGRLLNNALVELIAKAKERGDFTKFLKANDLKEEKEYHFKKTDEEPSSPVTKSDPEEEFDAPTAFLDILYQFKSAEEDKQNDSGKKIPNQKYLQKKRKAVFSNPADVLEQDSSFVPPKYEKSESERVKIKNALMNNMLTKRLSDESINTLIGAMQKKTFKKNDVLIQYGDEGKEYFVLE